jgi:hypothetical protein
MADFIGREVEITVLRRRLDRVVSSGSGLALAMRGRRQVGKSRLAQEFCDRAGVPYVFFAATKGASPVESIAAFLAELGESTLPHNRDLVPTQAAGGWQDAFRVLASVLPSTPCVVVLDELPWLAEQDERFDGILQTAWDRLLSSKPVLLLLLGSDIHMMERLTAYDSAFFGRADSLVLGPLNPAEVAQALDLPAADAIDAHLITGGLPGILRSWPPRTPPMDYLAAECADPASPVFGVPEATLLAEFPTPDLARRVLEAVGGGDRTFANVAVTAANPQGTLPSGSLSPLLRRLVEEKRVLAMDEPLSTRPGKPSLYRVADSNLRLYLAILRAAGEQTSRGRPTTAFAIIQRRWTSWRGRAVEPMIREALELVGGAGGLPWTDVAAVGGWWNRQFDPEVDLVGADGKPVATAINFTGSIKWLGTPFDAHDLASTLRDRTQVPGFDPAKTGLVVVSRSGIAQGVDSAAVDVVWEPDDVVGAWSMDG